jgi:hypothetical protein
LGEFLGTLIIEVYACMVTLGIEQIGCKDGMKSCHDEKHRVDWTMILGKRRIFIMVRGYA